jgi:3',5'-cyclic AMP phosphodiesterase CpdA
MIRLVHISDLHFGRDDSGLIDPLYQAIAEADPELVVVSGDLTQRARAGQFRQARAFLDRLPAPWLSVPGNHDVPLYNLFARMLWPYSGYKKHIARSLNPEFRTDGLLVQSLNTAWPFAWQRGHLRRSQLKAVCARFRGFDGARILVAHHPFQQSPETKKELMPNAEEALHDLAACGVDAILTGHLHLWRAEPFVARTGGRILQVHVGTGLSTRLRGQENDFAIMEIEGRTCTLIRMIAGSDGRFTRDMSSDFAFDAR